MKPKVRMLTALLGCALITVLLFSQPVQGQEMQRAYTDAELVKVREWEKTWSGKRIDKDNIDQVGMFLPNAFVNIIKDPDTWGAPPEGFYFTVRPYEFVPETPNFIAASKANAGKAKLAADGTHAAHDAA